MIVRKPYAFFIKHFRLFHIIFLIFTFMIIVSNIGLFEFFDDYINANPTIVSSYITETAHASILWPILLLVGLFVVMGVLIYKKKSIKLYIAEIITYSLLLVLFIYSNNLMVQMTKYIVDIRKIKAVHDFLFALCLVQPIMMALLFTRATGFDIKRFDFASDYAKLQTEETDREEVELNLEFDYNTVKTKLNKFMRYTKYFYLENKILCFVIVISVIGLIFGTTYAYVKNNEYVNVKNNVVNASKYTVTYGKAYVENRNISGDLINGDNFIILQANIKIKGMKKNTFNTSNLLLFINQSAYTPLKQYNQYFTDFGNGYDDSVIESSGDYYFVYQVPSNVYLDDIKLVYTDVVKKYEKKLEYIDLRNDNFKGSYTINEDALIKTSFMGDVNLKINEFSVKEKFLNPYIFKAYKTYYTSNYYVSPSISGNYDKSVIRFISNDCNFIEKYGSIYYDDNKSVVPLKKIDPLRNDDYCYFETDKRVMNASNIYLKLSVRGNVYKYYLK